jgi:hypothetical protein
MGMSPPPHLIQANNQSNAIIRIQLVRQPIQGIQLLIPPNDLNASNPSNLSSSTTFQPLFRELTLVKSN